MFILFSGPPRSGKDTAARIMFNLINMRSQLIPIWEKFSFPNKRAFAGMMNLVCDKWGAVVPYEATKDDIIPSLEVSYRQWQIDFSESYMKPLYGDDIFARLLLDRCPVMSTRAYIVSDCGFQIEVNSLPATDVIFIDLYRDGTTYVNDSRGRILPKSGWPYYSVRNDGALADLTEQLTEIFNKEIEVVHDQRQEA